jgi:RNA polymerase sigma factor (sigma-70 family)
VVTEEGDRMTRPETQDELAARFEAHRGTLQAVAYRMLGSAAEADDAVQETWLKLGRADATELRNLGGWLRTVVSRVCLDLLRSRASRREEPLLDHDGSGAADPERDVVLADAVGRALLVVLDALVPAERVAFVLHDMFAVPFDEIAPIVDRSPVTTKKLASRARQKVRGTPRLPAGDLARHRRVVDAFLAASRAGDLDAVLAVLAPDAYRRADAAALPAGRPLEVRGARRVAEEIVAFGRNARYAEPALIDGEVGLLVAPHGHLTLAITMTVTPDDHLAGYHLIADPTQLATLDLAVLATSATVGFPTVR